MKDDHTSKIKNIYQSIRFPSSRVKNLVSVGKIRYTSFHPSILIVPRRFRWNAIMCWISRWYHKTTYSKRFDHCRTDFM